jgi:hypothetical protein
MPKGDGGDGLDNQATVLFQAMEQPEVRRPGRALDAPHPLRRELEPQEVIASAQIRPEWFARLAPDDVFEPTQAYLQTKFNHRLAGNVSVKVLFDTDHKQLRLAPVPKDLRAALWLQFAQAVEGQKTFRECKDCGAWFELSPEVARTNRKFCSNACRLRKYRQRQAQAQEMNARGMQVDRIARRLDTDAATVRGWLAGPARGKPPA